MSSAVNVIASLDMNECNCSQCKDEVVYLMSAGYEWECHHCSHLNRIGSIPKHDPNNDDTVECEECHTEYLLMGEDHAYE